MLKEALLNAQNYTVTEKGALTHASTRSAVLDLFALGGSATKNINVENLILDALDENFKLAVRVIFYLSDIREGQGRRDLFRVGLKSILRRNSEIAAKLLPYIPVYGRWDYMYWFLGTSLEKQALSLMAEEVRSAVNEERPSLVFKWLASEDASSETTKYHAEITRRFFKLSKKEYRQMLSEGRRIADVVERKMSAGEWTLIKYESVPAVAMKRYRKAFAKHGKTFEVFIKQVEAGTKTIKSSVLYPADLLKAGIKGSEDAYSLERRTLVEQWKALPNYVADGIRALTILDTSGSMFMYGDAAIFAAASLAIYLAERLTGPFKNTVMSFSREAKLFQLPEGDFLRKYEFIERNQIVDTTNLQSVFDLILSTARAHSLPNDELPNRIVILSDMEFDQATGYAHRNSTNLEAIKQKYERYGYDFPQIIFWNVQARNKQVPVTMNENGVILVSGYSPSILKSVLSDEPIITPYKAMLNTIMVERYNFVDTL